MLFAIVGLAIIIFSVILHEVAHGFIADKLGDPTARLSGRLTLNPISHIDPLMSLLIPFILIISGSPIIFGAAKPVPIDPFNFINKRKDLGIVGIAGPGTNILLALLFTVLYRLFGQFPFLEINFWLLPFLQLGVFYNLVLAAFNLIPIPPLDGSRILAALLTENKAHILDFLEPYGTFILLFLLFFPVMGFSLGSLIFNLVSFWMRMLGFPGLF